MLEGIQILIDRMEMFPDDFREGGNLHDYLYILDETGYYKQILTEEEIAAYREATLKFHRETLNRKIIENVMDGKERHDAIFAQRLKQSMKNTTQTLSGAINNVFVSSGGSSGTYATSNTNTIGGGAFVTKTGALFTPANTSKKKKK